MKCLFALLRRASVLGAAVPLLGALALPLAAAGEPAYETLSTSAKACIVLEADSGRVLGGQEIHKRLPMASTTKMMTALLALEQPELEELFTVDPRAVGTEGSSMGLREGDQVNLLSLCYGMLLPSGNDAANATAYRLGGSLEGFAQLMNQRAEELGLGDTHYQNPSGLDAEGHYSSAYDLAKLCAVALEEPTFREICGLTRAQVSFGNPPKARWLENYNKLLTRYPGCIGVKTGFTEAAYRCLVSAAERDGVTLICVTLNCPDDWDTHAALYDHFFAQLEPVDLSALVPESLPLANGSEDRQGQPVEKLPVTLGSKSSAVILSGEKVSREVLRQPLLFSPVSAGEVVGELQLYLDGQPWQRLPLLAGADVRSSDREKAPSLLDRLLGFIVKLTI